MTIGVIVVGAAGRMGREVVRAVLDAPDLTLVAAVDRSEAGLDAGALCGTGPCGIEIETDLGAAIDRTRPEVMVDFTVPSQVAANVRIALSRGVSPVVGTTGLTDSDLAEFERTAQEAGIGAFVAPNFAIGAVLMMLFAAQAARYMPDVEIIELHHERKLDSPSGTALLTAQRIAAARREANVVPTSLPQGAVEIAQATGARGARSAATGDVPIHSVRLPGFVAHQEVHFGGVGQRLTIRHDSMDRVSFMPGVVLAIGKVRRLRGLTVGLEKLLD